jgi:16S rRNA (uracil1498-N3)-methyltransferase
MAMTRLFVTNSIEAGAEIELAPAQGHYLMHVLRLEEGAAILVFDGANGEWHAEIVKARKGTCRIRIKQKLREQTPVQDIHYAFAPLKQARLDYMVQKATEMGAGVLRPVITAHTAVPRLNLERMRANAIEAAEQCGVLSVPNIEPPVKLEALLRECAKGRTVVFCDERAAVEPPLDALAALKGRKITALIGPEGGFSREERGLLLSKDFVCPVSLGPRIMRADTAAVAILALIGAVLGDWS